MSSNMSANMSSNIDKNHVEYLEQISANPIIAHDHEHTTECLKEFIKRGYLNYSDIVDNPEKFFEAHQLITNYDNLEGFSVKFTVQYNLFAGSIMNLGTKSQKNLLINSQKSGELGCFMLTEYSAGVSSGMIVNTIAEIKDDHILINTPNIAYSHKLDPNVNNQQDGNQGVDNVVNNMNGEIDFENTLDRKNWISQGLSAKYGVVIAQLYKNNQRLGVYPFLVDMDDPNIHKKDNGLKTGINGLDNAQIIFKNLKIKKTQIMFDKLDELVDNLTSSSFKNISNGISKIIFPNNGAKVMELNKELNMGPNTGFMRVVTRLNSGRLCIATSLLAFVMRLVKTTTEGPLSKKIYLDNRTQIKLSDLPEIRDMLSTINQKLNIIKTYVDIVKSEYCSIVRKDAASNTVSNGFTNEGTTQGQPEGGIIDVKNGGIIPGDLIDKIMVAKIVSIDYGLEVVNTLRQKIGSNSLFAKNNLGSNLDILLCGRFAEGDNDILKKKLVMDRLKKIKNNWMVSNLVRLKFLPITNTKSEEQYMLVKLASVLNNNPKNMATVFSENYQLVTICANTICQNIINETISSNRSGAIANNGVNGVNIRSML